MQIGPYRVQRELARGGMGVVYRALAPSGAPVALKLLLRAESERARQRLQREVQALGRLRHPHVVRLLDAGEVEGRPWLALELVEGETLEARLRRGPLQVERARRIAVQLADALDHAHALGVLHRDLKPDNVLLRGEDALLTDFGLARDDAAVLTQLTASGVFLGTPGFWPPEQARGALDQIGPWSDLYGLGAVLYACLTGRPPVQASSIQESIRFHTIEPPSRVQPRVPAWLDDLCLRCLDPLPAGRPRSAAQIRDALEQQGGVASPEAPRARESARWAVGAAGVFALVVIVGAFVVLTAKPPAPPRQPAPEPRRGGDTLEPLERPSAERVDGPPPVPAPSAYLALVWTARAASMTTLGRYADAIPELDRALQLDPTLSLAWGTRGFAKAKLGLLTEAIPDFDRALELDPYQPGMWADRGAAKTNLGRHADAIPDLDRALELEPFRSSVWVSRALAKTGLGHYAEAILDYDRALELNPNLPLAWSDRGTAKLNLGRHAEAIPDYDRALELDPSIASAWEGRARAKAHFRRYAEAIPDYDRALELNPSRVVAWADRGIAKANLGRFAEALADLDRALELGPSQTVQQDLLALKRRIETRLAQTERR